MSSVPYSAGRSWLKAVSHLRRYAAMLLLSTSLLAVGCSSPPPPTELTVTSHERELTPGNYQEIVHSKTPALIDFSAAWCGPCQQMKPEVESLAQNMDGELVVAIADMTDRKDAPVAPIASAWKIQGFPTFVLVRDGKEIDRMVGANVGGLEAWVRSKL